MYTNADLKISLYVRLYKEYPENSALLILKILKLFACDVCEMFVYKHTKTIEYVKK